MARNSYWDSTILSLEVLNNRPLDYMNRCGGLLINKKAGWNFAHTHSSFNANNSLEATLPFTATNTGYGFGNPYARAPAGVAGTIKYYWTPTNSETGANGIIGAGDFTLHFWFIRVAQATNNMVQIGKTSTGYVAIKDTGSGYQIITSTGSSGTTAVFAASGEHHIALVRSGSTITLYKDGVAALTLTSAVNIQDPTWAIGGDFDAAVTTISRFSRVHLCKEALWTANFTPPTLLATEYTNTITFTLDESLPDTLFDIQAIEMDSLQSCGFMRLDTTGLSFPYTVTFTHGASEHFYILVRPARWGGRFAPGKALSQIGSLMLGRKADGTLHFLALSGAGTPGGAEPDWVTVAGNQSGGGGSLFTYDRVFHPGAIIGPFPRALAVAG